MNKYNGFLERISDELHILKESGETEENWKARVVYSVLGRMALASLWDVVEDNQAISVTHFKNRIKKMLNSYCTVFSELRPLFPGESEQVCNEIYNIYLQTGYLYHSPNRIVAASEQMVTDNDIILVRSPQLNRTVFMSGLGTYMVNKENKQDLMRVLEMFQLRKQSLHDYCNTVTKKAVWKRMSNSSHSRYEYLCLNPPFSSGYWKGFPDTDGQISLLRMGDRGGYLYCLYKYKDGQCLVSPLPEWMVEDYQYRNISTSLLAEKGVLPPLLVTPKDNLVYIKQNYLLPPAELNLLKLYSWPQAFDKMPNDFNRVMQKEVFVSFEKIMRLLGYRLEGENVKWGKFRA